MALVVIAPYTPTLAPVKQAIQRQMQQNLQHALGIVEGRYEEDGYPNIELDVPQAYQTAVIRTYDTVVQWPTMVIAGWGARPRTVAQQLGSGLWEGDIELDYFAQNMDGDILAQMLDRYADAMWMVLIDADEQNKLNGCSIDFSTMRMEQSEPGSGILTSRAVRLSFVVIFRV